MTSKAVISQLEVNERRLKGIYDQLESGSLKKAIAEADKVLKKNPNLLPAKVLKGLALYRIGKSQEAFSIVNTVVSSIPTDESTLNTLTYFFKESNQKNRIVDIYEEAYKQFPSREDICTNLFSCHVKAFNYLSQQKVAVQLRKLNESHMEYGMWPMIGNVLHGVYNNDLRLVKLGEAMITKYFSSNALLSAERIEFLIYIFEKLDKVQECYDWLCGSVLRDAVENEQNKSLFYRYKVDLLQKLGRKEEACILQWELIMQNFDDICLWRNYIDTVADLNLDAGNPNSLESVMNKLSTSNNNGVAIKVAMIHLSMALEKINSELSKKFGSKIEKIVEYFRSFGDRSSCFYDIYTILTMESYTNFDREEVLNQIIEQISPPPITNNKEVERHYAMMALTRLVKGSTDINVKELIDTYHTVLPLSSEFGPTEHKPCDNFVRLAVSCHFDRWLANADDSGPLLDAVEVLKEGLETSPANYNLRLQLSHLYGLLACQDLALGQFNDLEIKQLMWDSLGHHYIIPALSVPNFEKRLEFLTKNLLRKRKNKVEIEENLVTCYKLGNYGRIPEIIDFHQAIDASIMSCMSMTEVIYINTVLKSNTCDDLFECCGAINLKEVESSDPELDVLASLSYLKDFRDLTTSPDFAPIERFWGAAEKSSSFQHIVLWIAQRYLVLRAYYASAKVMMETVVKLDILSNDCNACFSDESSNYYNVLLACRRNIPAMWTQMTAVSGTYRNLHRDLTGCVEPPYHTHYPFYQDLLTHSIDAIVSFHDVFVRKSTSVSLCDWTRTLVSPIKSVVKTLSSPGSNNNTDLFITIPTLIGQLTVLCEMFALVSMNVSMLENMTKPMRPKPDVRRKNKKKTEGTGDVMEDVTKYSDWRQLLADTKFHEVPGMLVALLDEVVDVVEQAKVVVASAQYSKKSTVAICDSWMVTLDDSCQLLATKRVHLEATRQMVEAVAGKVGAGDLVVPEM